MEKMTEMFLSLMEAKARSEAPEIQKREEANRITKCLQAMLAKWGLFDGRRATRYLKEYFMEATIHKINEKVAIREFATLVEAELQPLITKFAKDVEEWKIFEGKVKEEFRFEDPDRVTSATFLAWVQEKNKKLGPQELLREFNRRYGQLSSKDLTTISLRRGGLLIRAADAHLRLELDNALDMIAPDAEEITWEQAEAAIHKVTKQRRRREIDQEVEASVVDWKRTTPTTSTDEGKKEVKDSIAEGSDIAALTDMIAKLALSIQALEDKNRGGTSQAGPNKIWNCLWCDSKEHHRRDCTELSEALRLRRVKFVEGKISFFDSGEPVPMNVSRGGMKLLVEQRLREQVTNAATTYGDPSVFAIQVQKPLPSVDHLDVIEKKRLAEYVRQKSGWSEPVLVNSITAEVGAAWNAALEKRRHEDTHMEDAIRKGKQQRAEVEPRPTRQFKQKEVQFQDTGTSASEDFAESPQASTSQDTTTQKKTIKKGPGYLLAREVERTIEGEEIAEKFWQQEARGFTNGDLFGSLRLDLQNKVLERARRKRIYKEGPHALSAKILSYDYEEDLEEEKEFEDEEVASVFCLASDHQKVIPNVESRVAFHDVNLSDYKKETVRPYWARACPEIEVQLLGAEGGIRALLDTGSELNLMSKDTYMKGQWMIDCDIKWNVNSVGTRTNPLWGACPDIMVKLGNVVEAINVFVFEKLPYPLILGVPFITELRMETMVLDDGTHMAKVKSKDDLRKIQFPTLQPGNTRNRRELRTSEDSKSEKSMMGKDFD